MIAPAQLSELEQELEKDFQKVYVELLNRVTKLGGRISDVKNMKDFACIDIDPKSDSINEAVQEIYEHYFTPRLFYSFITSRIEAVIEESAKIKAVTGISPSKEAIQNQYKTIFENGEVGANKFYKFTGIPPSQELLTEYPEHAKDFGDAQ